MKKILLLALIVLSYGFTFSSVVKQPKDIRIWFFLNKFTYQAEEGDYWKPPSETLKDRGGDCEDFAFLVKWLLLKLDIKADVVVVFAKDYAHAICVFKENNKLSFYSNDKYCSTDFLNTKLMLQYYFAEYDFAYYITLDKHYYNRMKLK